MIALLLVGLAHAFLGAGVASFENSDDRVRKSLEAISSAIEQEVAMDGVGSIALGVMKDCKLFWFDAHGYMDVEKKTAPTQKTFYRVGSISKSITAVLMARLAEVSILHYDDPVADYFPEFEGLQDYPEDIAITLRMLANHTSGLIREPQLEGAAAGPIASWEDKIVASIPASRVVTFPGERYAYSNIGYGILGLSLSKAADEPFMELVQDFVFEPLGMESTFVIQEGQLERLAVGYANRGNEVNAEVPAAEHAGRGYKVPNGGVYSTVEDMIEFMAGLSRTESEGEPFLSEETFEAIATSGIESARYGLGFNVFTDERGMFMGHGGSVAGYTAQIFFMPERGLGVTLLRNYNQGRTDLRARALEILQALADMDG